MLISIRLSDEEAALIKKCAELNGLTVSELVRSIIRERIEDEYDLDAYRKAMAAHQADPKTYCHEEVRKMLEAD